MTAIESEARSPGITYQELLDQDTHPVPDVLRLESPRYLGSADVPVTRYTSRAYHRREVARLWRRVWQFACREEHIPEAGDYVVYELAELSFFVIRGADGDDPGLPQRLPPPRPQAQGLRRPLLRGALLVPRLRLDARRRAGRRPRRLGLPPRRTSGSTTSTCPSARSPRGPGSCSSTPIRRRRRSRSSSAGCPSTSPSGTSSTATSRRTSPRSSRPTGRSPRRRSARRSTSTRRTPRSSPTSATPTPRSTCGTRSPA